MRIEKSRGVFVRELSVAEADDIFEIRAAFDQMAGRKLAATITAEQLATLRELLDAMDEATRVGDLERYHPLNLRFHDTLVRYANNPKLLQLYRRVVNELNLYRRHTLALRDRLPTSTEEHRGILDAIAAGRADDVGRMLHDHAMASRERMHTLLAAAAAASAVAVAPLPPTTLRPRSSTTRVPALHPNGHGAGSVIKA